MKKLTYIPEIDGLRAVAVIPVILYHLGLTWVPGGFLGVDVFFVISGYLITAILIREVGKPKKSYFYDFYLRRLRRIFPAFFTVVLTTLAAAYFILLPQDFLELGRSAFAAVSFVSNIYFYLNTGYFDLSAEKMPLLHTWSLGVEEQFYLIWPAFILVLSRLQKITTTRLILGIFVSSFLLSIYLTPINSSLAFYNLPFRVFQFLLGAMIPIFLFDTLLYKRNANLLATTLQFVGFCLILLSISFFSSEDSFPGWLGIVPSLGASIFIVGATLPNRPQINPIKNRLIVGIGKISFSLYLWHWPVITLFKTYSNDSELSVEAMIWLLLLTVMLSVFSYWLIEKPFRRPTQQTSATTFSLITASCVVAIFFLLMRTDGFSNRLPDASKFSSLEEMWEWGCPLSEEFGENEKSLCYFGVPWGKTKRKIVLWGDSHAEQLPPLFEVIASDNNISFVLVRTCRPVTDGKSVFIRNEKNTKRCYSSIINALEFIENDGQIELVIISGAWTFAPEKMHSSSNKNPNSEQQLEFMQVGLSHTVDKILELGPEVLLLGDTPHPGKARFECAGQNTLLRKSKLDCGQIPLSEIQTKQGPTEKAIKEVAEKYSSDVTFHSIIDSYCSAAGCPIFSNQEYIFRDRDHIRRNLSDEIKLDLADSFDLISVTK